MGRPVTHHCERRGWHLSNGAQWKEFMRTIFSMVIFWLSLLSGPAQAGQTHSMSVPSPTEVNVEHRDLALPPGWVSIPAPHAKVHADPADRATAMRLARHAAEAIPRLAAGLEVPVGPRMHIVVAHTQSQFQDLQPGRMPDWADGSAWSNYGWIFLKSPDIRDGMASPLETVLDHEIVHILLGRAFHPHKVPRWLQEGMAQLLAREFTAEKTKVLARGTLGKNLISLHQLSRGFPKNPARAHLAYAQSADLVAYIQNEYGPKALPTLVREMAQGEKFPMALRIATGRTIQEVDTAWRARLTDTGFSISPIFSEGIWWGLGALLVPLAFLTVRRRNKVRMEKWRREEVLEDALARVVERAWGEDSGREEQFEHPVVDVSDEPVWH